MENIITSQLFVNHFKKHYQKPEILKEILLEAKAGSVIVPPTRAVQEPNPIISPGDFTINNEP